MGGFLSKVRLVVSTTFVGLNFVEAQINNHPNLNLHDRAVEIDAGEMNFDEIQANNELEANLVEDNVPIVVGEVNFVEAQANIQPQVNLHQYNAPIVADVLNFDEAQNEHIVDGNLPNEINYGYDEPMPEDLNEINVGNQNLRRRKKRKNDDPSFYPKTKKLINNGQFQRRSNRLVTARQFFNGFLDGAELDQLDFLLTINDLDD